MSELSDDETEVGVLIAAKDAALKPLQFVTSRSAQKIYLGTFLTFLASSVLLGVAAVAYILFYFSYVPDRGFSLPIYLQFGPGHSPLGTASIPKALAPYQRYDAKVVLHMPRTASNKAAGNFMVDLKLLAPTGAGIIQELVEGDRSSILAESSRPAILTYHSTTMEQVHRAAALPLHVVGWREEAETLKIPMIEGVEFPKGWRNIPDKVSLELRSDEKLQVYTAKVEFTARLRGLRYFMYNFRVTSFLVLTFAFWIVEMVFAALVWLLLLNYFSPPGNDTKPKSEVNQTIKGEQTPKDEDALSDTPHDFPSLHGQPPLRYTSPRVKEEQEEEPPIDTHPTLEEADDEDDEANVVRDAFSGRDDSGIGTSMESSGGRPSSVRRRQSRTFG